MSDPILENTKARLAAFLEEARRVGESEFPYLHAREAVARLVAHFEMHARELNQLSPENSADVTRQRSALVLKDISTYVPVLGFLLRSTNIRNAFEVYGPLARIAKQLLGTSTKLIVSSEWNYSPLTYNNISCMPGFVLIGLPAPESSNPLLIPLAGHELGHPLWRRKGFHERLRLALLEPTLAAMSARPERCREFYPNEADDLIAQRETKGKRPLDSTNGGRPSAAR